MTLAVEDRSLRHARARAIAASILDAPPRERGWDIPERLHPSPRRRLRGRRQVTPTPRTRAAGGVRAQARRRALAVLVLLALCAAVGAALALPVFRVATVDLQGAHLLSRSSLLKASGIASRQSIFTVDADGARRRIAALRWVRSADVVTEMPAAVSITVAEETPTLRFIHSGGDVLVAADGATLDVADAVTSAIPGDLPTLVDLRPVAAGTTAPPLDHDLLRILADTAARFPQVFGVAVSAFRWQPDGLLTIVAAPGWRAVLGSVATTGDVAVIPQQLAALAALKGRVDFVHPKFGYVDLEDPAAAAVGGIPGQPLPVLAPQTTVTPSPAPLVPQPQTSVPPAAPTPAPAAAAAPSPIVVPVTH